MTLLLAGDVGGTKTLLSLHRPAADDAIPTTVVEQRYGSADWDGLAAMVRHFLESPEVRRARAGENPAAACFAVAGPVEDGEARLTNLPWDDLRRGELAAALAIEPLELVNDFAVLVYALPRLGEEQQAPVRGGSPDPGAPRLIIGAGTGLGVALGVPVRGRLVALASEAAHASFAPRSEAEWELAQWLRRDLELERLSIERVVSGTGLGHVARWLLQRRHPDGDHPLADLAARWRRDGAEGDRVDLPAEVSAAADRDDPLARDALDLWLGAYGAVAGDLALTSLCHGGIWLAGGTAPKLLEALRSPPFARAFLAKGRLRHVLEGIPLTAILEPAIGSQAAACRALELLG